ncbi:MAG: hypothetical protein ACK4NC_04140 [Candidatus Gracilibacteria bacterium]
MKKAIVVTSGNKFIDIDGFACVIAYAELLTLQGKTAVPLMTAHMNSSVPKGYIDRSIYEKDDSVLDQYDEKEYVILDLSDPKFFESCVEEDKIIHILDHHPGFEKYWGKIGERAVIESIGAAATLVVREFEKHNLLEKISKKSAEFLAAAILSNTLIFQMSMTTQEDKDAYETLKKFFDYDDGFEAQYFSEVVKNISQNIPNALRLDSKSIEVADKLIFISQLELFQAEGFLEKEKSKAMEYLCTREEDYAFLNLVELNAKRNTIVFRDIESLSYLREVFLDFEYNEEKLHAVTPELMLRKELLKGILSRYTNYSRP